MEMLANDVHKQITLLQRRRCWKGKSAVTIGTRTFDRQQQHGPFDTTYKHVSTAHSAGCVFCSVRHTGGGLG